MTRTQRVFYWLTPMLFCVALYRFGLSNWFSNDDFAWLNLKTIVTDFPSLLRALFAPLAQGTIRPLSERAFFMGFSSLFGLHAWPYHTFVFLTQFVNIALLMTITRRLTGSIWAAFLAPLLWVANVGAVIPLAWASAYNQVLCAMFLLLSFFLFLRYTETGRRADYVGLWATFLLGFGANELMVVFPAIALLYALVCARRYLMAALPLFGVSAIYTAGTRMAASHMSGFYYDMDFHAGSLASVFWQYWQILIGVNDYTRRAWVLETARVAVLPVAAALLGFCLWQAYRRRFLPLFFLGWFVIAISPFLLLHNHVSDYYLFVPMLGLAMLAGYALALALARPWTGALAAALALLYFVPSTMEADRYTRVLYDRGKHSRILVEGVVKAKQAHPGATILLDDVDDQLFWSTIYDSPFRGFGWRDVLLTPESVAQIHPDPHLASVYSYALPAAAVFQEVESGHAFVYEEEEAKFREVTRAYKARLESRPPPPPATFLNVAAPYLQSQIGEGWYGIEDGHRWSQKHAVVFLGGPTQAGEKLRVKGWSSDAQTKAGPLHFALTIDGRELPVKVIDEAHPEVQFMYDVPGEFVGKRKVEVAFTLDRTVRVGGDVRELGLVFGEFGFQ